MSADKKDLQDAINRALKAANRALKRNLYNKVADIYYRIAYMLNDLGNHVNAKRFADAAKQFKEKNILMTEINNTIKVADEAYRKGNYAIVAEYYSKVSSLSKLFGDKEVAEKFMVEAEKYLEMAKIQLQPSKPKMTSMSEIASNIQSQIPSAIKLKKGSVQDKSKEFIEYDEALVVLGLICIHCGHRVDPDLSRCPNCNGKI